MEQINFGIRRDLQADIRYEPNACNGYVLDLTLGCPHRCIYCIFSPLERKVYKLINPGYTGEVIPLKLDRFLEREEYPPVIYLCYSSDPLAEQARESTKIVLERLFSHNVSILFLTKGIFTDEILEVISLRPDLMHIQIGITNPDRRRNEIIEPRTPSYRDRLNNFRKLGDIKGLGSLSVRIDPLFPLIDDTAENINGIIDDVSVLGVKEAVLGYVILTEAMKENLSKVSYLKESVSALTEKTPTISKKSLYSFPFEKKVKRLYLFQKICLERGVTMATCSCKDGRLKGLSIPYICHPFYRKKVTSQ
jgi:DNA repair photolyase